MNPEEKKIKKQQKEKCYLVLERGRSVVGIYTMKEINRIISECPEDWTSGEDTIIEVVGEMKKIDLDIKVKLSKIIKQD